MINLKSYQDMLRSKGSSLGGIRVEQSKQIIDKTFTNDPSYKQVRVLTRNGWIVCDAKYQRHSKPSLSKDAVDWYLEFRPNVYFPVGTYVIVPNNNDTTLETYEDQVDWFKIENRDKHIGVGNMPQLWFIVTRTDANAFVRYSILQCNWNFQWIHDGKIQNCIGALRNANSYTSGVWQADYMTTLDNLSAGWMPDTHAVYGDTLENLGLCDNRTITHGIRFMISNNSLNPSVSRVTKVIDMAPHGVIKLSLKQDEFDLNRDDKNLFICDYYNSTGNIIQDEPEHYDLETRQITEFKKNENGELGEAAIITLSSISVGGEKYYGIDEWTGSGKPHWRITLDTDSEDAIHPKSYYENLMRITEIGDTAISIKPGKAKSLVGKHFTLCIYDSDGNAYSTCKLEVTANEA